MHGIPISQSITDIIPSLRNSVRAVLQHLDAASFSCCTAGKFLEEFLLLYNSLPYS